MDFKDFTTDPQKIDSTVKELFRRDKIRIEVHVYDIYDESTGKKELTFECNAIEENNKSKRVPFLNQKELEFWLEQMQKKVDLTIYLHNHTAKKIELKKI